MKRSLISLLFSAAVHADQPYPDYDSGTAFVAGATATLSSPVPDHGNAFVSRIFGHGMVLQRAPQQAVLNGHSTVGATVTTNFNGAVFKTTADSTGVWRQKLPATEANVTQAYTLTFMSSSGERAALNGVLFGDVYVCGGQSNMAFSVPGLTNATAEAARADAYPHIRLFTVDGSTRTDGPVDDLQTFKQNWSIASNTTIARNGEFGYFSAVCWLFGRDIADSLNNTVPLGLISNNVGGTPIERWLPSTPLPGSEAWSACNRTDPHHNDLYNTMIYPYTIGPLSVTGFTWYQGESNTNDTVAADRYACLFPGLIQAWRTAFANPALFFGFVQLSTFCTGSAVLPYGIPEMREAQMAALALPRVGYATNADHGDGCNIHPPSKQFCAKRLANAARAIVYGQPVQWRSPTYESAVGSCTSGKAMVTVTLNGVGADGLTTDHFPENPTEQVPTDNLAWAEIKLSTGDTLNATVTASGSALVLEAPSAACTGRRAADGSTSGDVEVVASSYGWGAVPMMNAYDIAGDLPVLPWNKTL